MITWPRNSKDKTRKPGAGADIDKADARNVPAAGGVCALEWRKHGERVNHVARHDLGLVGDGGKVHPLNSEQNM